MGKKKNPKKNNRLEFPEMTVIATGIFILWNKVVSKWVSLTLEKVQEALVASVIRWHW